MVGRATAGSPDTASGANCPAAGRSVATAARGTAAGQPVHSEVVKITLLGEDGIRLEDTPGPLTVEAESAGQAYSPFHMLGSALATCTFAVLHSWATQARLDVAGLGVEVHWTFADSPHRVGHMRLDLRWPGLPEARRAAAVRAASLCAVHATLSHPPDVAVEVVP